MWFQDFFPGHCIFLFLQIVSPFLRPTPSPLLSILYPSACPSHLTVILCHSVSSHGNVPQMPELYSFILNLAHSPDPFTMAVGNTAYFSPPLLPVQRGPGLGHAVTCPIVPRKNRSCVCRVGVLPLCLIRGCFLSCKHIQIKMKRPFILDLKQWPTSFSWVTVRPQSTSRTKRLS